MENFLSIPDHAQQVTGEDNLKPEGRKDCQSETATQRQHFSSISLPAQTHLAVASWEDDPEHLPILTHPLKFSLQLILNVRVAQYILHQILLQSAPQGPLIGIIKAEPADGRAWSRGNWALGPDSHRSTVKLPKVCIPQKQDFGDKNPGRENRNSRPKESQWDLSL